MKKVITLAALVVAAFSITAVLATAATGATAAGQMINITSVSVSPDRHVTVDWTGPPANGIEWGSVEIATKPDAGTDGRFFRENVILNDSLTDHQQHWVGSEALTAPGTYYVRVSGWWDGYSSSDYENYGTVYSQVVPFTVNPTCTQVVVSAGHYVKKLVRKGHSVKRNGNSVWVKPVYKKVWIAPVYKQECH